MKILNTVIKMEHCELHKATDHSTKCDLIYDVNWLVLLLYVPSLQLRSLRDGQFTEPHFFPGQA